MARKQKIEVLRSRSLEYQHRTAQRLDSIAAVRREMGRLFRAAANGKIPSDEAARLTYVLKEIRACLEAEPPPLAEIPGVHVSTVVINGVKHGEFLPQEEIDRLESQFIAPPVQQPPAHISGPPMLRVYESEESEPEPPAA